MTAKNLLTDVYKRQVGTGIMVGSPYQTVDHLVEDILFIERFHEIEEAKKEKSRAYHRQYSKEYRVRNLEKQREYDRMKAREYRAKKKAQAAAAQPTQ